MVSESKELERLLEMPQQLMLRQAQKVLKMTRNEMCTRFCLSRRSLDKWMLPATSNDFREIPEIAKHYICEIVARERAKPKEAKEKKESKAKAK